MNRRLTFGVIPALVLGALVLPVAVWWGDLPDPMATHWDLSGMPNGSMPPGIFTALMVVIFGAIWAATARAAVRSPGDEGSFVALLWFVVAWLLIITLVGLPVGVVLLIVLTVWLVYRISRGWLRLRGNQPMYA